MKKILFFLIIISLFPLNVLAQQDITVEELTEDNSQESGIDELDKIEEERTKQKANLLGFLLPEYTDNPSYIVEFQDPSPEKDGVEININENGFQNITSPYTFPALNIGSHNIKFRFKDENGYVQLLEYDFLIIPRTPIINTPVFEDTLITIEGTSLPNSEVIYSLNTSAINISEIIKADENGNWIAEIPLEKDIAKGVFTFVAYTRKYGYASNLSEAITFNTGDTTIPPQKEPENEIFFSFKNLTTNNISDVLKANTDLIILVICSFLSGIVITLIIKSIVNSKRKEKNEKKTEEIITKTTSSDGKTLRELFGSKEEEVDKKKKEYGEKKDKEKKKEKEVTIVNKDVFLRKYKHIDPDTDSGKEEEDKKKIEVSLTSKKKEKSTS
jgi:hypothetical protein